MRTFLNVGVSAGHRLKPLNGSQPLGADHRSEGAAVSCFVPDGVKLLIGRRRHAWLWQVWIYEREALTPAVETGDDQGMTDATDADVNQGRAEVAPVLRTVWRLG
jgi:hypothetical protein